MTKTNESYEIQVAEYKEWRKKHLEESAKSNMESLRKCLETETIPERRVMLEWILGMRNECYLEDGEEDC